MNTIHYDYRIYFFYRFYIKIKLSQKLNTHLLYELLMLCVSNFVRSLDITNKDPIYQIVGKLHEYLTKNSLPFVWRGNHFLSIAFLYLHK